MPLERESRDAGIPALVTRLADGLGRLVTEHISLARMELTEDAKAMGAELARIAVFIPFILVGYLFVCGAAAAALASFIGWAGALGIVGGLNLLGGAYGAYAAAMRLKNRRVMDGTFEEFSQSAQVLAQSAAPVRNTLKEAPRGQ